MSEFAIPRRKFRKEPGKPLRDAADAAEWARQAQATFDGTALREYLAGAQELARAVFRAAKLSLDPKREHVRGSQIVHEYETGTLENADAGSRRRLVQFYREHQHIKPLARSQIDAAVYCAAHMLHKAAYVRFDSTPAALATDIAAVATWRERMLYTLALSNTKTANTARTKNKQLRQDRLERYIRDHGTPANTKVVRKTLGYAADEKGRRQLARDLADVCAK